MSIINTLQEYEKCRAQYMALGLRAKELRADLETLAKAVKADPLSPKLPPMADALDLKIRNIEQEMKALHLRMEELWKREQT